MCNRINIVYTNPTVVTGAQGPIGPKGDDGEIGPKGDDGQPGPTGLTGPSGADGTNGTNGSPGATGATGPQGPSISGMIVMFGGTISGNFDLTGLGINDWLGWTICNGVNTTVDLSGRFIVGYDPDDSDYNSIGDIGGSKTVTLNTTQIPEHTHPIQTVAYAGIGGSGTKYPGGAGTTDIPDGNTDSTGGGLPHENRPPFYTLAYVIKL